MNKLMPLMAAALAITLSGCAAVTTNSSNATGQTDTVTTVGTMQDVGMSLFKTAVDERCRSAIEQNSMWRVAQVAMSTQQQETTKTNICGCVSEQAPQQVSLVDIANASMDSQYRTELVTKVVTNSLQTCYTSMLN